MRANHLPEDHKAYLRRRIANDAEIKALRADLAKLDEKRRPIQFRIRNLRNRHRDLQVKKYLAELALRRQRKEAQRAVGGAGEAKLPDGVGPVVEGEDFTVVATAQVIL